MPLSACAAGQLLGQLRPSQVRAVAPLLLAALNRPDPAVRLQVAQILMRLGSTETKAAIPALVGLLDEPDVSMRLQAAQTIRRIGPEAQAAIPALVELLDDLQVASAAAGALSQLGPAAVQAVIETWNHEGTVNRPGVIQALAIFGPAAKLATPKLITALTSHESAIRNRARKTLEQIGPETVPFLVDAFREGNSDLRQTLAQLPGNIRSVCPRGGSRPHPGSAGPGPGGACPGRPGSLGDRALGKRHRPCLGRGTGGQERGFASSQRRRFSRKSSRCPPKPCLLSRRPCKTTI